MKPLAYWTKPSLKWRTDLTVPRTRLKRTSVSLRAPYRFAISVVLSATFLSAAAAQKAADNKQVWKPVQFAILRYNEDAPKDWNLYHTDKRGVLLVRLWKRYLLVNVADEEIFDIDPEKVKAQGDNVELSSSDVPGEPTETSEWKVRDVGPVRRIRFRFGKTGNFLEIQLPLLINGKPAY
jgi:hypothetical protein